MIATEMAIYFGLGGFTDIRAYTVKTEVTHPLLHLVILSYHTSRPVKFVL